MQWQSDMSQPKGIHRRLDIQITDALRRRFWDRVEQGADDECWPWKAAMRNGYGAIKHQKKVHSSHRLSYILTFGFPSEEMVIAHKCDNRACCNPSHLEAIPVGQNNRDARSRVYHHVNRGEDAYNAVLTKHLVERIVEERKAGLGAVRIARKLNLNRWLVRSVIQGKTWVHITGGRISKARKGTRT